MAQNNSFSIIDLDNDDNQPIQSPPNGKPTPSPHGISSFVFPKLHQMLQRRKGKPEEENKIIEIVPEVMKVPDDENQVCQVVSIVPLESQSSQLQVAIQIDKQKILFDENNDVNIHVDAGETNLLVVEEVYEPLVSIQPGFFQNLPMNIPDTNKDNPQMEIEEPVHAIIQQKQIQAIVEPQILEVCEDIPIIDQPILQPQAIQPNIYESCPIPAEQPQPPNQQHQPPNEQHQQLNQQHQPSNEQHQPPNEQSQKPNEKPPIIEQVIQISSSPWAPLVQVPAIAVPLQTQPDQTNKQGLSSQQIRKLLMNLLPDMDSSIQNMNDQELAEIYKSVKSEIEQHQLHNLIDVVPPQPQKPVSHAVIEAQNQPSPPQIEQIQQRKQAQPEKEVNSLDTLRYFKTLPYEEMKAAMKRYFTLDSAQYDLMDHHELIEILDQCIVQIDNSSKNDEMQQIQPIQSLVSQVIQSQRKPPIPHQQKPIETISIDAEGNKIAEMRQFLVQNIPSANHQQLQKCSNEYIKMLYDGAVNGRLSRAQISQKVVSYTSNSILERCLQNFSQLKASLSNISEDDIYKLMNYCARSGHGSNEAINVDLSEIKQIIVQNEVNNTSKEVQTDIARQKQPVTLQITQNQRRTHDMMLATNPQRPDERASRNNRKSPAELREKLMNRLPELKQKIMMLDDSEIEKIYLNSIDNNRQSRSTRHHESEARPVIVMKQKKPMQNLHKPEVNQEEVRNVTDQLSANGHYKGKVWQINGEQKKKKSRTIIFVHTQEDSEEDEVRNLKMKRTENGVQRNSGCDCLQKVTVGALLKRLTQLIDNKN